jgi:hypothetical protein
MLDWDWLTDHKLDHYIAHDGRDSEGRFTLVFHSADDFHAFVRGLAESIGATITESRITLPIPDIVAAGGILEWTRDPLTEDKFLELFGIEETGFTDELDVCDSCQKIIAFREEANFCHGDDMFCLACVEKDPTLYLEDYWAHEEPHNFILDPKNHEMGFPVRGPNGIPWEWKNGMHIGDEDTPGWMWKTITDLGLRAVMKIDSDMFTVRWTVWTTEDTELALEQLLLDPPECTTVLKDDNFVAIRGSRSHRLIILNCEGNEEHVELQSVNLWTPPKRVIHPTGQIAEAMLRSAAQHMNGEIPNA